MEAIDARYKVGQAFDAVDTEFIRAYAAPNQDVLGSGTTAELAGTQGFSVSRGSGTHTCKIGGTVGHYGGPINYSWKASTKFTRGSGIKAATLHAYARGYGIIGSHGIGLVYSSTPRVTTTSSSYYFNRSGSYSALEVYFTIYVDASCSYSSGSYTVKSPLAWE
ncbi:hypothetical protein LK09_17595 [Microbacterium mangrovi]|uniref:Uncharacterized protein n=1 Tax=Microbacterium mangrovi TaxID=1348253 RepID=A0A0B2A2Q3_9MICO|nr:hypothetical protein LK09_17595 [Microbacterium mangrovi]